MRKSAFPVDTDHHPIVEAKKAPATGISKRRTSAVGLAGVIERGRHGGDTPPREHQGSVDGMDADVAQAPGVPLQVDRCQFAARYWI